MKDPIPGIVKINSSETYIEFLTKMLGASREEILQVTRHSGISARRIAEYLLKQQTSPAQYSDDE
jgi:hypothetical protein